MFCNAFEQPHLFFFFNDTAPTEIYTLSLHDALPISRLPPLRVVPPSFCAQGDSEKRSDERGRGSRPAASLGQECPVYWPSHEDIFERLALEVVLYYQSEPVLAFIRRSLICC